MCPEPSHAGAAESEGTESEPTPLLRPAGGIPDLCVTVGEIAAAAELLDRGRGPFAVDAERASGFRYSGRAYLIQIRRAEAGTVLIDPVSHGGDPLTVLAPVAEVLSTNEWILHSADQDLPCLAEVGMRPPALYDTELAGRLAGFDRVNLAAMVERLLGLGLTKGHGAADWSKRPLPSAWLNYAALDVELLIELRAAISRVLAEQGKTDWAAQEFEHLRSFESRPPPAAARQDRWRRTSGIHKVHDRRGLAAVRELWTARDRIAQRRDIISGLRSTNASAPRSIGCPPICSVRNTPPSLSAGSNKVMVASSPTACRSRYAEVNPEIPPPTTQYERGVIASVRARPGRPAPRDRFLAAPRGRG